VGINLSKNLLAFSIAFLGICIVLGSWFISQSLKSNQNRYEIISGINDNKTVFDKQTGDYWQGFDNGWKKYETFSNPTKLELVK